MFVILALAIQFPAQALTPTTLFRSDISEYDIKLATDGTNFYNAICKIINFNPASDGTGVGDLQYTVFDESFGILCQFTLKGAYVSAIHPLDNRPYDQRCNYDYADIATYDLANIILTKDVFSTDGKWCAIIEENKPVTESFAYISTYSVYTQDDVKIGDLPMPANPEDCYPSFVFSKPLSAKVYLAIVSESDIDELYIYSFVGQSSLSSPRVISKNVVAHPNPLPQGEALTIELGREAPNGTFVTFSDMRGRLVDKVGIRHGETVFTVTPRNMARGAHIYTVYFGDGELTSGKLLSE